MIVTRRRFTRFHFNSQKYVRISRCMKFFYAIFYIYIFFLLWYWFERELSTSWTIRLDESSVITEFLSFRFYSRRRNIAGPRVLSADIRETLLCSIGWKRNGTKATRRNYSFTYEKRALRVLFIQLVHNHRIPCPTDPCPFLLRRLVRTHWLIVNVATPCTHG